MQDNTIFIDRRFCGPPDSANGGYICGRLAAFIDGPAGVRLMSPPPLETEMRVVRDPDGLKMLLGDECIAVARPAVVDLELPQPPSLAGARAASKNYRGFNDHIYPTCFVCGTNRDERDGLRLFAGPNGSDQSVAATWVPDDSLAGADGSVATEFVWAALDCPGAFSFNETAKGSILLGELAARIDGTLRVDEEYIVTGWQIEHDGRRHITGTAIFDRQMNCMASARGIWFEVQ